jgi:L-arabinose isomerase
MNNWLKSRWSMKQTGNSFRDIVTGDSVRDWVDCYGDKWMAVSKWGFRVKINEI